MNGNYPELTGTLSVLDDNYGGGRMLVHYLYERGSRQIAGIFKTDDIQGHQRYAGYADELRTLELPFEDQQVLWYSTEAKDSLFSDEAGARFLERLAEDYNAVVCYNDEIASRLIAHLLRQGISVPGDLAVVSFDNSQYSEMTTPRITSLSHGTHNVGRNGRRAADAPLQGRPASRRLPPGPWSRRRAAEPAGSKKFRFLINLYLAPAGSPRRFSVLAACGHGVLPPFKGLLFLIHHAAQVPPAPLQTPDAPH